MKFWKHWSKTASKRAQHYLPANSGHNLKYNVYMTIQLLKWLLNTIHKIWNFIFLPSLTHTLFTLYSNCVLFMWTWLRLAYLQRGIIQRCTFHHNLIYLNKIYILFKCLLTDGANLKTKTKIETLLRLQPLGNTVYPRRTLSMQSH